MAGGGHAVLMVKLPIANNSVKKLEKYNKRNQISPIVVLLQVFPFSTAIFMEIVLRKSRILFLIQWGVFKPPEALPIHTLSKLLFLIHKL